MSEAQEPSPQEPQPRPAPPEFADFLESELEWDRQAHLTRSIRSIPEGIVCFSGNDYLGLSRSPLLIEAARRALVDDGVGAGAARLISGNSPWHRDLEESIAQWRGTERALLFPTGYATACGTLPALLGKSDFILIDKRIHACQIDGARLSGARMHVFQHNDLEYLESLLRKIRLDEPEAIVLIAVESLYSMDGDFAPLRKIVDLKEKYGAWLMVDEAHAVGLYGDRLSGMVEQEGLTDHVDIHMGTLGKSVGVAGGFVAGPGRLIDFLIQRARTFIFTTGTPPSMAAAACRGIEIIQSHEGLARRKRLYDNVKLLRLSLRDTATLGGHPLSPIAPIMLGRENVALECSRDLLKKGFYVPSIRYPTVPRNSARLRVSLSSEHTEGQIKSFANALRQVIS